MIITLYGNERVILPDVNKYVFQEAKKGCLRLLKKGIKKSLKMPNTNLCIHMHPYWISVCVRSYLIQSVTLEL